MYIQAQVKFNPTFTCRVCKARAEGETERLDFRGDSLDLHLDLQNRPPNPNRMPDGWASYGQDGFACPQHVV